MTSWNRVKSNCDVVANFSLIFRNSEFLTKIERLKLKLKFLMKIFNEKFPNYVTQKFYL